jgi:glycosyltransferase involved in cell wall biosynthesis
MKVYLSNINESWVIDRFRNDWLINNKDISTNSPRSADIIWIISPWIWNKISKKHLKNKKTLCSIYHIDFENFDDVERKDFYNRDQYIDEYHVISKKTEDQLKTLTNKKITSIPFWVDNKIFFNITDKSELRRKYGFKQDDYVVGSFQRDTEGHDLKSPKLIKGPDILFNLICKLNNKNKNLKVLLAGKRRQYIINKLNQEGIPFQYFEMADINQINELYNILDLYLVTSRLEGGPQAILEAAISKTPILSTDVGVASEILHENSIFSLEKFLNSKPNIEHAFQNAQKFIIPIGMRNFRKLLFDFYEN